MTPPSPSSGPSRGPSRGLPRWHLVLLRGALRVMVVGGFAVALVPFVAWIGGGDLVWDSATDVYAGAAGPVPTSPGASVIWDQRPYVTLDDAGAGLWLLSILPSAVVATGVAVIGFLLLKVLYATDEGTPFFASSARRLRAVALTVAVVAVAAPVARGVADAVILERAVPQASSGVDVDLTQLLVWLVVALVVGVVAEAFRVGTVLREDTEGLV